jgi:hypothetical protein
MPRVVVPKVPLEQFLELSKNLRGDPRFHLTNQDVRNGMVCFRTPEDFRVLNEIIDYHNTGRLPASTVHQKKVSRAKMDKLAFNMQDWIDSLEPAKGPDGNDFYQTRCPSCARRGRDADGNHLVYTLEGVVHCYAGCKFFDIIDGYYKGDE